MVTTRLLTRHPFFSKFSKEQSKPLPKSPPRKGTGARRSCSKRTRRQKASTSYIPGALNCPIPS